QADQARRLLPSSPDCLANPPVGVGTKLGAIRRVKGLQRPQEAQVPILDEVGQIALVSLVALSDVDHQAQICREKLLAGDLVSGLDPQGEQVFFLRGKQGRGPDLREVEPERIGGGSCSGVGGGGKAGEWPLRLLVLHLRPHERISVVQMQHHSLPSWYQLLGNGPRSTIGGSSSSSARMGSTVSAPWWVCFPPPATLSACGGAVRML